MTWEVVDEVPIDPATARVYAEGWQSWSPATWYAPGARGLRPDLGWQHTMRFRPGTALPDQGVQAEGLLVADPGDGGPVHWYASRSRRRVSSTVPSIVRIRCTPASVSPASRL